MRSDSRSASRRRALSLVEVLLTLVIFSLALAPIINLFTSAHRIGHAARRLVDVTLHAQAILEALAELEPVDFPASIATSGQMTLMADSGGVTVGQSDRYDQVVAFFQRQPLPVAGMQRTVNARRLQTGELEVWIVVDWLAVIGEEKTKQTITLSMLSSPRNWQ